METSEQLILAGLEESMCSVQECPASRRVLPGSEEARAMSVGSGKQCAMLLNQSDLLGVFSKILLESSVWASSGEYCYVWERLDTRFDCSAFQLTQLGQSIDGNGCSLLPTATAQDAKASGSRNTPESMAHQGISLTDWAMGDQGTGRQRLWPTPRKEGYDSQGAGHGDLVYEVKARLWQTPVADDCVDREKGKLNSRGEPKLSAQVKLWRTPTKAIGERGAMDGEKRLEQGHCMNLQDQVKAAKLWPTPTERDWKSTSSNGNQDNSRPLSEVAGQTGQGSLNPVFVEWLMGLPPGWTELTSPPVSEPRCLSHLPGKEFRTEQLDSGL